MRRPRRVRRPPIDDWRRRAQVAATGRRSRLIRPLRFLYYAVVKCAVTAHRRLIGGGVTVGWFQFSPRFTSPSEHADALARAAWYLPDLGLPVKTEGPECRSGDAPWMQAGLAAHIEDGPNRSADRDRTAGHRLIHRATPWVVVRSLLSRSPSTIVDARLYNVSDSVGYEELRKIHRGAWRNTRRGLHPRLRELMDVDSGHGAVRKALVLATGPSAEQLDLSAAHYDVRITCNSAVRNAALLHALRPHIIAFADPVFHFGPSRYAAAFREDVCRAVEATDALLLVPWQYAELLVHHHPQLDRNVVSFEPDASKWAWPSLAADRFLVRPTANILTLAMLPAAFATATEVHIAGADGRERGERYFWRHSKQLQYSDKLMETVFAAHPSFFRDRVYGDYYETHCEQLESLIRHGEDHGKRVRAVTPSHVPALQRRGAAPISS